MASNIDTQGLDETFPEAGVDNDSQVLRDNFSTIKSSLDTAKDEIVNLQDNALRFDTETQTLVNNDLQGLPITDVVLDQYREKASSVSVDGNNSIPIDLSDGHYQEIQLMADVTLPLTGWPDTAGSSTKQRLAFIGTWDSTSVTVTLSNGSNGFLIDVDDLPTIDSADTDDSSGSNVAIIANTNEVTVVELWKLDNNPHFYIKKIGVFNYYV